MTIVCENLLRRKTIVITHVGPLILRILLRLTIHQKKCLSAAIPAYAAPVRTYLRLLSN